jgi:hypothetical protein
MSDAYPEWEEINVYYCKPFSLWNIVTATIGSHHCPPSQAGRTADPSTYNTRHSLLTQ